MPRSYFLLLLVPYSFLSCTAGPPEDAEDPTVEAPILLRDTVVADQIEHTAEAGATIAPTEPESQAQLSAAPVPTPRRSPVAPPPPTNTAPAAPPSASAPATPRVSDAPSHEAWKALLQRYVSAAGKVNYHSMKEQEGALNEYLALLAEKSPDNSWSRDEALAYWINAYNAFTVKLILENYPLKSIRDLNEPWDRKWIQLGGKTYSLNQIEHDIVRPTFREPRIHFALVCAAKSCPPLANTAYTAGNLEQLLERRAKSFINNEQLNVTQEEVVRVSPLFDWYGQDFGNVREYLNKYLATDIPSGKDFSYLEYDWSLNE